MPDNLTAAQRSYCMSRIKGKDTGLEIRVRSALHKEGLRFRKHVRSLPGRPDVAFIKSKVAIFIDGDFWHGYGFPSWKQKVSEFWVKKISGNRARDRKNHQKLRRMGWTVIRLWQHQLEKNFDSSVQRIISAVENSTVG